MNALLAIPLLLAIPAHVDIRVTTVDGRVATGTISEWNNAELTLTSSEAVEQFSAADVLRVDMARAPITSSLLPAGEVTLVDGSRLAADDVTTSDNQAVVNGALVESDANATLDVPLPAIRTIRFMQLNTREPHLAAEWRDLLAMNPAGDMIVVRKPETNSLYFVEGTLGSITPKVVQFTLDGQTIDVNREKVFGVVYYRTDAVPDGTGVAAVVTGPGVRLPAREVKLDGDALVVSTPQIGVVRLPIDAVRSVDYSVDRLQYLSDLDPTYFKWTPPAGDDVGSSVFSTYVRDRSFFSPELQLEYPAGSAAADRVGSSGLPQRVTFAKGLAVRSRAEIAYRVPQGFPTFRATVGIDPRTRSTGSVELVVLGDDQTLARRMIVGGEMPIEIDCSVEDIRKLTLVVEFGSTESFASGFGDTLHLAEARFTK